FVGYFPADAPEYSCIVVINNPKEGYYYGSSVAIPVFREISDNIYATTYRLARKMEEPEKHTLPGMIIGKHEDIDFLCHSLNIPIDSASYHTPWIVTKQNGQALQFLPRIERKTRVPNLLGMTARDAVYLIEKKGMQAVVEGRGFVVSQSMKAGTQAKKGKAITIKLST
ncbi:MAG: PASTA domain-containing protein, partial [Bacteroidales bacterium]